MFLIGLKVGCNMQELKELDNIIIEYDKKIETIKAKLIEKINSLPDNKKIKRLNNNCFTINFSALLNNWTPTFYDFKIQYKKIVAEIEITKPENLTNKLNKIIKEKKIVDKDYCLGRSNTHIFKLHPEVVEYLKQIVNKGGLKMLNLIIYVVLVVLAVAYVFGFGLMVADIITGSVKNGS